MAIVREIIKTAIENKQNLIIEGCYVPFDWQNDFSLQYLQNIKYCCLVMSQRYIKDHFLDIKRYANVAEERVYDGDYTMETALAENERVLKFI